MFLHMLSITFSQSLQTSTPLPLVLIIESLLFFINFNSVLSQHRTSSHNILCYECENAFSNTLCNSDTQLTDCEDAFDTCQTIIHYSGLFCCCFFFYLFICWCVYSTIEISEKMTITKSCTRNTSCWDQKLSSEALHPCYPSKKYTWTCVDCCWDDKCNRDNAISIENSKFLIFTTTTISISLFNWFYFGH